MELHLNAREASLLEAFRRLPPDAAAELTALTERLAGLATGAKIDWSDSWSDEDLKEPGDVVIGMSGGCSAGNSNHEAPQEGHVH